jgi:hypothetical protein
MQADLEICGLKNDLARLGGPHRQIKLRLLPTSQPLGKDSLDFDPEAISQMMRVGYDDAAEPYDASSFAQVRMFIKLDKASARSRVSPAP